MTLLSPFCPLCGNPPMAVFGPTQALCDNDACRCMLWDPSQADGGLSKAQEVDLSFLDDLPAHGEGPAEAGPS